LAKTFFHLVAMDSRDKVLWRKALTWAPSDGFLAQFKPSMIGMEARDTAVRPCTNIRVTRGKVA
jgi:hypothetical protein